MHDGAAGHVPDLRALGQGDGRRQHHADAIRVDRDGLHLRDAPARGRDLELMQAHQFLGPTPRFVEVSNLEVVVCEEGRVRDHVDSIWVHLEVDDVRADRLVLPLHCRLKL